MPSPFTSLLAWLPSLYMLPDLESLVGFGEVDTRGCETAPSAVVDVAALRRGAGERDGESDCSRLFLLL